MCVFIVFIIYQRKQNAIIAEYHCPNIHSVLFSFMMSLTLLWHIIRNPSDWWFEKCKENRQYNEHIPHKTKMCKGIHSTVQVEMIDIELQCSF